MKWWIAGLMLVAVTISIVASANTSLDSSDSHSLTVSIAPNYPVDIYLQPLSQVRADDQQEPAELMGGIVPHHLLAGEQIVRFFDQFKQSPIPKLIVWITPNHSEAGTSHITTAAISWKTPFGVVPAANEATIISQLPQAELDNQLVASEAAVIDMMPWLSHYWPQTPVLPVILSKKTTQADIDALASALSNIGAKQHIVVFASVDFSHYLPTAQADAHDELSWSWIQAHDYQQLISLNSDYMDSPTAIITLLKYSKYAGTSELKLIEQGNSGYIVGDPTVASTGYITALIQKKEL